MLFGTVQLTMIGWGIAHGERPAVRVWAGLALAAGGLTALMLPSSQRPDPIGVALMVLAGIAWGAYSLMGRSARIHSPPTPAPSSGACRSRCSSAPLRSAQ